VHTIFAFNSLKLFWGKLNLGWLYEKIRSAAHFNVANLAFYQALATSIVAIYFTHAF
jgi:hypothetical protein